MSVTLEQQPIQRPIDLKALLAAPAYDKVRDPRYANEAVSVLPDFAPELPYGEEDVAAAPVVEPLVKAEPEPARAKKVSHEGTSRTAEALPIDDLEADMMAMRARFFPERHPVVSAEPSDANSPLQVKLAEQRSDAKSTFRAKLASKFERAGSRLQYLKPGRLAEAAATLRASKPEKVTALDKAKVGTGKIAMTTFNFLGKHPESRYAGLAVATLSLAATYFLYKTGVLTGSELHHATSLRGASAGHPTLEPHGIDSAILSGGAHEHAESASHLAGTATHAAHSGGAAHEAVQQSANVEPAHHVAAANTSGSSTPAAAVHDTVHSGGSVNAPDAPSATHHEASTVVAQPHHEAGSQVHHSSGSAPHHSHHAANNPQSHHGPEQVIGSASDGKEAPDPADHPAPDPAPAPDPTPAPEHAPAPDPAPTTPDPTPPPVDHTPPPVEHAPTAPDPTPPPADTGGGGVSDHGVTDVENGATGGDPNGSGGLAPENTVETIGG